ncbi:uncharacterized protein [Coffea arabica]|uniref:CCHC-type domain-containing protein n=2 Tax=Coffea arabica TaxID=13443 RepID=A0ABM4UYM0_COFAR
MESSSESAFKVMNQDFVKLDRFDGTNFSRWKDKMMFFLTALKIAYVLDPSLPEIPEPKDGDSDEVKAQHRKRAEDELLCRGHIMNTLSDRLYDLYTAVKSPKEIWNALEYKYNTMKQGADKFLIMQYFDFRIIENSSLMDQIHDLQVIVSKLHDLKVEISESLQVGAIIAKLPTSWNDYKKKLLHTTESFTTDQILKHLRIEEDTRNLQKKQIESDVKVNALSEKNSQNFSGSKRKSPDASTSKDKKKNRICYKCGKKGHYKRECKADSNKKQKKDNAKNANLVEQDVAEIVAMISHWNIGMISELHVAAATKSCDWWYDSGATVHVCNDKSQFKTYEEVPDGHKVLMGNHDTAKVIGIGSVDLQFTSGKKLILANVLHVPEIRKNLVSADALNKKGLKAVIESNKLIFSLNGVFVGKGYSCDGMFKLCINKNNVSVYIVDASYSLWHGRLAHTNHKTLQFMSKHGLISFKDNVEKRCETCIQAKMTRLPFPKAERNNELLDLVHSDKINLFKMKDLGEVDTILGIKVKRHSGGYSLSQSHYVEKVLNKYQHLKIKEVSTPYDPNFKLFENSGKPIAQLEYASAIGSLMYATHCTRPDISYAVCRLARYTKNPGIEHWKAIGRVLRYLKRTKDLELSYNKFPVVLEGYSDASWVTSVCDKVSTSGWIFMLGGGAVSWASKKQTVITHSTMEAEFVALAAACKEAEWLRNLLLDIELWPNPMPAISLHCDSEATMSRALNRIYNGKSRHISLRHEYVRQLLNDGIVTVVYVRSFNNLADPFTKALSRDVVKATSLGMGLKPIV